MNICVRDGCDKEAKYFLDHIGKCEDHSDHIVITRFENHRCANLYRQLCTARENAGLPAITQEHIKKVCGDSYCRHVGYLQRALEEVRGHRLKLQYFCIDPDGPDAVNPYFVGYGDGTTWNGWQRPYFTFEVAMQFMAWQSNLEDNDYSKCHYDKMRDAFWWPFEEMEHGGDYEGYVGEDIDGKHLYRIGDGWIWIVADEDYRRAFDARKGE